jgi:putative spermidine/putrescine transport system ATP-binding protein
MGYILETRGLTKLYGATAAIQDIALKVIQGEILVILGPSGSGKSTFLKSIAGVIDASSGQILLRGRDITYIPIHERNLGLVMQGYSLFPHMTAYENVAYPLRTKTHRCSAADLRKRVSRMFELTGLGGLEERKPSQISGGQQQRVALARALVFDPDVLLLDEPLGALDRELRERMVIEIRSIQRTLGTTAIYITHDQAEAMSVADRIAVLRNGSIAQIGTPVELYRHPASQFVAEFLGGANLLRVIRVRQEDSGAIAETPVGNLMMPVQNQPRTGEGGLVMVRPEHLHLGVSGDDHNRLAGTVVDVTFLGNMWRATVALADDTLWCVNLPSEEIDATFKPGQKVDVFWKINNTQLIFADSQPIKEKEKSQ